MDAFTIAVQYVTAFIVMVVCNVAMYRMWRDAIVDGVHSGHDAFILFVLTACALTIDYAIIMKFIIHRFCDA